MKKIINLFSSRKQSLLTKKQDLYEEGRKVSTEIFESFFNSQPQRVQILLEKLQHLSDLHNLAGNIIDQNNKKGTNSTLYVVGTKFLDECFEYLTSMDDKEVFHYVTGLKFGDIYTLDNIQKVKLKHQSSCGAETDSRSSAQSIINIDRFGHFLHATFHTHPAKATNPSSDDIKDLREFTRGGYKTIGGIFTMDGFIRFYSLMPFEVQIYGKGVKKIDDNLYKFTNRNKA